jgi:hypothetical protein
LIANWKWNDNFEDFYATYERIRAIVSEKEYPESLLNEESKKRIPNNYRFATFRWDSDDIPSLRKVLLKFHYDRLDQAQQASEQQKPVACNHN